MDREDLELFARSLRDATGDSTGQALDGALEELGWREAMAIEPQAAIATLFELQGASNATSSALGHVLRHALGLGISFEVILPAVGQWNPPGVLHAHGLNVQGLATTALHGMELAVVIAAGERGHTTAFAVPVASLTVARVGGVDPDYGLVRVTGVDVRTLDELGPHDWTSAVALARLSTAHELVGASRTMLELGRQHAVDRVQFGRPIASFQAIRHRLADSLVAIEMAAAMLDAAWLDMTPDSVAMAKAMAGRQARATARHCQQVLAGIGFTTEHPLHRYVRRTLLLDALFGTSASLTKLLGEEMIRAEKLPALLPL